MDTHVHAAPDLFGRAIDDEEAAFLYKERGLEALALIEANTAAHAPEQKA
jgi:hypothetical protein